MGDFNDLTICVCAVAGSGGTLSCYEMISLTEYVSGLSGSGHLSACYTVGKGRRNRR